FSDPKDVRYFQKNPSAMNLPAGLTGYSTLDSANGNWADFTVGPETGVAIALSFRRACSSTPPALPVGLQTSAANCFEDSAPGMTTVDQLCNQGTTDAIVQCYYTDSNNTWPSQPVESG